MAELSLTDVPSDDYYCELEDEETEEDWPEKCKKTDFDEGSEDFKKMAFCSIGSTAKEEIFDTAIDLEWFEYEIDKRWYDKCPTLIPAEYLPSDFLPSEDEDEDEEEEESEEEVCIGEST